MCILFVRLISDAHGQHRLLCAANRDEFVKRPTAPLALIERRALAGVDLQRGGTWLSVSADSGRFAFLTNVRVPPLDLK